MKYIIKLNPTGSYHYVEGLDNDAVLIYRYPGGDIDTRMRDKDMMHSALYDLFQCNDDLKSGDIFETEFGTFFCDGIHVHEVQQ